MEIDRKELIEKYIKFFKSKGHAEIRNSSLVPENDPTVLFTTAGMHPLVPFLLGEKHPQGKRLCNVQRCIRTGDIDEVGDTCHHTMFEMLGNWSLGDYFKKEAIEFSFEFLTKVLKIPLERFAVTVFAGDDDAPRDDEAAKIWEKLGVAKDRIAFMPKSDNWWGPAGKTGPCGPDTEMFYWKPNNKSAPKKFDAKDKNWVEIWNDVLMQYNRDKRLILVDGMGCLYNQDFEVNPELLSFVNSLNTHTILTVNGFREKGRGIVNENSKGCDSNWEAFSLEEEKIKKENQEYFKRLLKKFDLIPEEVIYIEHDENAVKVAESVGIKSFHYKDNSSAIKFIENNLYAYLPAKQKNIDTGMGVERTVAILNGLEDNYLADMWKPIIDEIEHLSGKKYKGNEREMRIIADHIKASVFIIADGVVPGNSEQGYVLRRLIRRAVKYGKNLEMENFTSSVAKVVLRIYEDYEVLKKNKEKILAELSREEERFNQTLEQGFKIFKKAIEGKKILDGKTAFLLYQSYGFPVEMVREEVVNAGKKIDEEELKSEIEKHQELSRTASAGKFKSGLADNSDATKKLHTATHLLNEALRVVLKNKDLHQKGSNITPERLRFDFNFDRKLTDEELKKVEDLVNAQIKAKLPVVCKITSLEKAKHSGAQGVFDSKYDEEVKVYHVGEIGEEFSKEICAGPHVDNTSELGHFKIVKEESSSSGVRRIKAVLE